MCGLARMPRPLCRLSRSRPVQWTLGPRRSYQCCTLGTQIGLVLLGRLIKCSCRSLGWEGLTVKGQGVPVVIVAQLLDPRLLVNGRGVFLEVKQVCLGLVSGAVVVEDRVVVNHSVVLVHCFTLYRRRNRYRSASRR